MEVGKAEQAKLERIKTDLPRASVGRALRKHVFHRACDRRDPVHARAGRHCSPGSSAALFGVVFHHNHVLLAIPTSILGTFIVMYFLGFTRNTFTVLGLTLVVASW